MRRVLVHAARRQRWVAIETTRGRPMPAILKAADWATSWFGSVTKGDDSPSVGRYATARLGYYFQKKEEYLGMPLAPEPHAGL